MEIATFFFVSGLLSGKNPGAAWAQAGIEVEYPRQVDLTHEIIKQINEFEKDLQKALNEYLDKHRPHPGKQ